MSANLDILQPPPPDAPLFLRQWYAALMNLLSRVRVLEGMVLSGSGSPEGAVTAPVGTLFLRSDGGTSTTLYVKETGGSGDTGWVAK